MTDGRGLVTASKFTTEGHGIRGEKSLLTMVIDYGMDHIKI